jgi:predicted PurR-regulated permease PerM
MQMNIFGIDLSTVPWPMFMLLVFMAAALFWYLNVYLPAIEQLEEIKEQNKNILSQMNKQMIELTTTISDIQRNVYAHKAEESNINIILHDIETYAENLNDISSKLMEKELIAEGKIENMKGKIEVLTNNIGEIKDQFSKKKFF